MGSVNKVILVGNLGRDAELRYTPGGAAVATFSMATTEVWNDKAGQRQEKTEWHRVVLWGKPAESLHGVSDQGQADLRRRPPADRQWDDKDGNKRYTTEIRCDRVVLLGGGGGGAAARRAAARGGDSMGGHAPAAGHDAVGAADRRRYSVLTIEIADRRDCRLQIGDCQSPIDLNSELCILQFTVLVFPPVSILEPHHVVQLRRRDLEDVAVFDRRHAVNGLRRDVDALAGQHLALDELAALLNLEQQLARVQVDRLVLEVVILQAQRWPALT